jgi:hypothetical protein
MAESTPEYEAFVDKFKLKKTTDDCYTPANVYDAVADYVAKTYNLDREKFVRPFYPGGNYEAEDYPPGCCVVDNPPFSILNKIIEFYLSRGVRFFLFDPAMTTFSPLRRFQGVACVCAGVRVTYTNGADVRTSWVTNLEPNTVARSAPELFRAVDEANQANLRAIHADLPRFEYPPYIVTASMLNVYSRWNVAFAVKSGEGIFVGKLDEQKEHKKGIYGGGLLLSDATAKRKAKADAEYITNSTTEQATAEKKSAYVWQLSERERRIVAELSRADAVA